MSLAYDEPDLEALVQAQIDRWRQCGDADAAAFLNEHPELRRAKSLVLELIHEEYCLRRDAGHPVLKSQFCERFPTYRQSVFRMLEVQEYLDQRPAFAAELHEARWPVPGETFMGFDVVEMIGCGAVARVFLAREPDLGERPVVIKVSQYGGREAATLGKLSHPGIVPVHSVKHDEVEGWTAICMPLVGTATAVDLLDAAFVDGKRPPNGAIVQAVAQSTSLKTRGLMPPATKDSRPGRGSYAEAVARIGWQLAGALEKAHSQGVLHRDIKPSNVLLAWSGRAMLLDFNLATDQSVASERVGGTPAYMAPEAIAGLMQDSGEWASQFDPRSDIYSLGAVLFELLTGRLPAQPENADRLPPDAYHVWLECKQAPPPAIPLLASGTDRKLESIVRKCLAVDPADRYATARELARDLKAYLGVVPSLARSARRNLGMLSLMCVLTIAFLGGGSYYVATRPAHHLQLMAEGLRRYDQGQYERATEAFSACLKEKPGFPAAHFARGQAYRKLGQWNKARAEFVLFEDVNEQWAYALAGECDIDLKDELAALTDLRRAYDAGLREIGFLLNYADVLRKRDLATEAIEIYSSVLAEDPQNSMALCNRAVVYMSVAMRMNGEPTTQCLDDARRDVSLNPHSFESPYTAARIFAYATSKNKAHREEGVRYLVMALERGLPGNLVERQRMLLKPLLTPDVERLLEKAPPEDPNYRYLTYRRRQPSQIADWQEFLRQADGRSNGVRAGSK